VSTGHPGRAPAQDGATELPGFHAVIPAGGSGTRLWPLSRRSSPKFLHDLTGSGRSLLQDTVHRLTPLCADRLTVVTGALHEAAVRDSLADLDGTDGLRAEVLVEPSPLDSMPAIGLAAATLERHDPDVVIGSFAADHVVRDTEHFHACVREAVAVAQDGALVTLGITPTYPATGYGYIRLGAPWPSTAATRARRAEMFVEKPDLAAAQHYLAQGDHLWNAGMFVVRASVLLDLLADLGNPELAAGLREIAADPGQLERIWPTLPRLAIDHAVAEPAAAQGRVAVVPADFGWDDVGDFASLAAVLQESADHPGMRILGANDLVLSKDSTGVVAAGGGRTVVTLGIPDVVVIDTPDAILVTTRERVQDVKSVVESLRRGGREDLT
jgi:mannose-1-phosphate guanylyltransferase